MYFDENNKDNENKFGEFNLKDCNMTEFKENFNSCGTFSSQDSSSLSKEKNKVKIMNNILKNINDNYNFDSLDDMISKINEFETDKMKCLVVELYSSLCNLVDINGSSSQGSRCNSRGENSPNHRNLKKVNRSDSIWKQFTHKNIDNEIINTNEFINDYGLLYELGSGSQGTVHLAVNKKNNMLYAIKALKNISENIYKHKWKLLINEITIIKNMKCDYIVKLHEIIEDKKKKAVYLVMDYINGGSILEFKNKNLFSTLEFDKIKKYTSQLVSALTMLHSKNVLHGDLKPDNILKNHNDDIVLIDFGTSKILEKNKKYSKIDKVGTILFFAPELCLDLCYLKIAPIDIWSLGVNIFLMLFGYFPFYSDDVSELKKKIILSPPDYPQNITQIQLNFFQKIFNKEPTKRMKLHMVMSHELFMEKKIISQISINKQFDNESYNLVKKNKSFKKNISFVKNTTIRLEESFDSTELFKKSSFVKTEPYVCSIKSNSDNSNPDNSRKKTVSHIVFENLDGADLSHNSNNVYKESKLRSKINLIKLRRASTKKFCHDNDNNDDIDDNDDNDININIMTEESYIESNNINKNHSFNNHSFNNHSFNNHSFNNHSFNNHSFNNHSFNNHSLKKN
jgi:serine/threonine protein kinase